MQFWWGNLLENEDKKQSHDGIMVGEGGFIGI
jgi:hypothetical protein